MGPALMSFCEAATPGFPVHPAETWSNLAPLLAGIYLLYLGVRRNLGGVSLIGLAGLLMALGSGAFHGTATRVGELLDFAGMVVWVGVILGLSLARHSAGERRALAITTVAAFGVMAVAIIAPGAGLFVFTAFVLVAIMLETRRSLRAGTDLRYLGYAAGSLAVAFVAWVLDQRGIVCDPTNHVISLHGVWHILNALPLLFVASHFFQCPFAPRHSETSASAATSFFPRNLPLK